MTNVSEPIVILFDDSKLRKLTATDMTEFFSANSNQNFRLMSEFFARIVVKAPEAWGPVEDPQTFSKRPFLTEYREIIAQFMSAVEDLEDVDDKKPLAVKFDFNRLTGEGTSDFFDATRRRNYVLMAQVFAQVVTQCPATWGAADKPKTYTKRPYFGEFIRLMKQFGEALKEEGKN